MAEEDTRTLRVTARIAAILGQLPVKNLKDGLLQLDLLSPIGIWNIFLLLYHIIVTQTVVGSSGLHDEAAKEPIKGLHIRGTTVMDAMSRIYLFASYMIYIFWLCSLSKFLTAWRALEAYDQKYTLSKQKCSPLKLVFNVIQIGILWIETIFNALSYYSFAYIKGEDGRNVLQELSWIAGFLSMRAVGTLVALHTGIIQFASGLAIMFILELSRALVRRIDMVQNGLHNTSSTKQVDICSAQVKEIMEIHEKLRDASNLIVTTFLGFASVLIIGFVFLLLANKDIIRVSDAFVPFVVMAILYFLFALVKVLWLTNSGEALKQKVIKELLSKGFYMNLL